MLFEFENLSDTVGGDSAFHVPLSRLDQACREVAGFEALYALMQQRMSISGKSQSTLKNYSHHVAKMTLHFGCVPTELDEDQINDYLYLLQQQRKTPSESYFKFTVYGLRYAFRISGLKDKHIALPSIKKDKKLPVVLSREEVKRLMKAPTLLKHRVLIGPPPGTMRCRCGCNVSCCRQVCRMLIKTPGKLNPTSRTFVHTAKLPPW